RLALIVLGAGPIALAAALPIQGEPAYRWLIRAVRYLRSRRDWRAQLTARDKPAVSGVDDADKSLVSDVDHTSGLSAESPDGDPAWQVGDNTETAPQRASPPEGVAPPDETPGRPPA